MSEGARPMSVTRLIVDLLADKPDLDTSKRDRADWHARKAEVLREIAAVADPEHRATAAELAVRAQETADLLRLAADEDELWDRLGVER